MNDQQNRKQKEKTALFFLIENTVQSELRLLFEKNKHEQWQEGDSVSPNLLNKIFKTFHFSNDFRGDLAKLTPRIPKDPWMNDEGHVIEDDFTKRISLGPTIQKAIEAIGGEQRPYLYAGDIRKDPSDDFETLETNEKLDTCPSSEANDYGPEFSISSWIDELYDEDLIDGETTEDVMDQMDDAGYGDFGPKDLPGSLQTDFTGCVPDADVTQELWSLKPVQLFLVAFNSGGHFELTSRGADILNHLKVRKQVATEMKKPSLETIIEKIVQAELCSLKEAPKQKLPVPGKDRPWQEGDPTTIKQLEKYFTWFHLSDKQLGKGDYFKFTPRVPRGTWDPIEDNFTKRISLAPSIKRAVQAVDGHWREHIYAADIKGYDGDNIDIIDLTDTLKDCPKSPGNKYGPNFNISKWLRHLDKTNQLTPADKRNNYVYDIINFSGISGLPGPKGLPKRLKNEFEACVPDARKTKEVWAVTPEIFMRVVTRDEGYRSYSLDKIADSLGIPLQKVHQSHHAAKIKKEIQKLELEAQQQKVNKSKDKLYLTAAGAKVFNAIDADADEITYFR